MLGGHRHLCLHSLLLLVQGCSQRGPQPQNHLLVQAEIQLFCCPSGYFHKGALLGKQNVFLNRHIPSKHPKPWCREYCAVASSPRGQGCSLGGYIHSSEPTDSATAVNSSSHHNVTGKLSTKPKQNFSWASTEQQCDLRWKNAFSCPLSLCYYFICVVSVVQKTFEN